LVRTGPGGLDEGVDLVLVKDVREVLPDLWGTHAGNRVHPKHPLPHQEAEEQPDGDQFAGDGADGRPRGLAVGQVVGQQFGVDAGEGLEVDGKEVQSRADEAAEQTYIALIGAEGIRGK
jgi:hypothetical protein